MRPLPEAQQEVLDAVRPLPVETVSITEAVGLALAVPVTAPHDIPPFPNSAMDGYAVRAVDVALPPVELPVLEDVPAGSMPSRSVEPATAIKIMTGATLPEGADAIVPVEDTASVPNARVRVLRATEEGAHVRAAGGDLTAGDEVFPAGLRLGPAHLAVLAAMGVAPRVHRRPVVAIMSTGDELVPANTAVLGPGMIRDSNRVLLEAVVEATGGSVVDFGIIADDAADLHRALAAAASEADVVVTSGGVSMGEYDLIKQVLGELGTVDFWQVAMQPGKPFAFGTVEGTPLFGLPGNPVSVFVAFEQFVRPALLRMMGADRIYRERIEGTLGEKV
ncbi:MAG: gephyrin-like molybdotransferase Glp, partial [Actinomycetota bacterium]|nr:gephyrin-like molybdotransferase Glp [Actinomycetota bacterium]